MLDLTKMTVAFGSYNAPQNFAVLRRIAVNLLGKDKSRKFGTKNKQFLASMNNEYLADILGLNL
jgi:hypothetical protein